MNLPPLSLIDGCLFIDNSGFMEGVSTCSRYLQYRTLNLRIPSAEKASLNFGTAIHLCLEHRYRKYSNQSLQGTNYYNEISEILTKFYADHPVPLDDWRTMNYAMELMKKYNQQHDIEEFSLLSNDSDPMVELSFAIPLFEWQGTLPVGLKASVQLLHYTDPTIQRYRIPIIYTGRIDLPIQLDGQIFVMDHKTSGQMGSMFWDEMRMTGQQRGYCWAFEQLTGKKVAGYYVNGIRTKEVPQYVLKGKEFTGKGGKKSTPESFWKETFQRERFILKPGELDEWKNNTIDLVEEFFWHYQRGYMPMKTKWCAIYGKCPYYGVCSLELPYRDAFLNSGEFVTNLWSPLKQPTNK